MAKVARASKLIGNKVYQDDTSIGPIKDILVDLRAQRAARLDIRRLGRGVGQTGSAAPAAIRDCLVLLGYDQPTPTILSAHTVLRTEITPLYV
jgi:sporulation protein YlmC with PRC-barrel domain